MYKKSTTFFVLFLAAFLLLSSYSRAANVNFTAKVSKQKIGVNETLQYVLSVQGVGGRIQIPEPPDFKDFDKLGTSQSQSMQIINGRMSSSFNLVIELLPRNTGKFTIPPGTFRYDGKEYKSNTVEVEVLQGQKKPQTQAAQRMSPTLNPQARDSGVTDNVFLKTSVNKNTAVANEPILLTIGLYNRMDLYGGGNMALPDLSGFSVEMLNQQEEIRDTIVDGKSYMVREWYMVLFPTTTGNTQ